MFLLKEGGIATVFHSRDGEPLRAAKRLDAGGEYFASPVHGDGKIYLASANGKVTVLNSADYEELAVNDLGESIIATPAISDGRLFVRTRTQVLCFANGLDRR
jgi:outer membrane protein assembly factor BamB